MSAFTDRECSGRHLDGHAAEQHRREVGARPDVVVTERVVAVDQQLTAVVAVIVRQLRNTTHSQRYPTKRSVAVCEFMQLASMLRGLTCHMGSHNNSATYHPSAVTFPSVPPAKLVLDLETPEGCKPRVGLDGGIHTKMVDGHPSQY